MSKHTHHQSKTEQMGNKAQGATHDPYDPYHENKSALLSDIQARIAIEDDHIQLRAYQIHQQKGGLPLDNWLEAERSLR